MMDLFHLFAIYKLSQADSRFSGWTHLELQTAELVMDRISFTSDKYPMGKESYSVRRVTRLNKIGL